MGGLRLEVGFLEREIFGVRGLERERLMIKGLLREREREREV